MKLRQFYAAKIFIAALFFMVSTSSWAQYTCNELPYLKDIVRKLESECALGKCTALGRAGSTVASAIKTCVAGGFDEDRCASNVTCTDIDYCTALGRAGDSVNGAISQCTRGGFDFDRCASNVECFGIRFCKALGRAGSSIESAVDNCVKAGFDRDRCASNVTCQ